MYNDDNQRCYWTYLNSANDNLQYGQKVESIMINILESKSFRSKINMKIT